MAIWVPYVTANGVVDSSPGVRRKNKVRMRIVLQVLVKEGPLGVRFLKAKFEPTKELPY